MKIRSRVVNPGLAALLAGSGFSSLQRFAEAVNLRGWQMHGIKTNYDHITVKRWLAGSVSQYPDVVAAVLSDAWGIDIPVAVLWPQLRNGQPPVAAHLQPWVAARTLETLADFLRTDMLTRREALSGAVQAVSGAALLAPLERWLGVPPGRLAAGEGAERIGITDVVAIERSTKYFAATDAEVGGALSREAAVGQLKYAVDLARHASYSDAVGNRLLAAIAELSGMVGWLCQDSRMPGPAQRYFVFGLQAARESTDPRAPMLVVSILSDMAQVMRWRQRPQTALRLIDLATNQLPADRSRFNVVRSILASRRAEDALAHLGSSAVPEVRSTLDLAVDLHAQASDEERATTAGQWHRAYDTSAAHLSAIAASAYLVLARQDSRLAREAEQHTLHHLAQGSEGHGRNRVLSAIRLARIRFAAGEAEQASHDGHHALDLATGTASAMVKMRLRELLEDAEPYAAVPAVAELRDRVQGAIRVN